MRQANHKVLISLAATVAIGAAGAAVMARAPSDRQDDHEPSSGRRAKNVILFIGDGMGVSTITATRVYSVGVAGQLVVDQFPYTALSRTYSSDSITADSAPTMTAMMTGYNTNAGVLGLDETTEFVDFNKDGDGKRLWTLLEQAKREDMRVGVISTARITHATPAATFAHINDRNNENAIALQALPGDADLQPAPGRRYRSAFRRRPPVLRADDDDRRRRWIGQPDGRARPARRVPGQRLLVRLQHGRLQQPHAGRACPCSASSSAATWSTSTTGRRTPAESRASRT